MYIYIKKIHGGWGGKHKRKGKHVYLWLIPVIWQKPTQHCKAIIL